MYQTEQPCWGKGVFPWRGFHLFVQSMLEVIFMCKRTERPQPSPDQIERPMPPGIYPVIDNDPTMPAKTESIFNGNSNVWVFPTNGAINPARVCHRHPGPRPHGVELEPVTTVTSTASPPGCPDGRAGGSFSAPNTAPLHQCTARTQHTPCGQSKRNRPPFRKDCQVSRLLTVVMGLPSRRSAVPPSGTSRQRACPASPPAPFAPLR